MALTILLLLILVQKHIHKKHQVFFKKISNHETEIFDGLSHKKIPILPCHSPQNRQTFFTDIETAEKIFLKLNDE